MTMTFTPPEPTPPAAGRSTPGQPATYVWARDRRGAGHKVRDAALSSLAVLGVLCMLGAAMGALFGVTPLVVRSGSMAPGIPVGALALSRAVPAERVQPGEVVSVVGDDGVRVTHRVVELQHRAGSLYELTLRGDANAGPDPTPAVAATVDRVFLTVPGAGRLLEHLGAPPANFAAGALTGAALLWAFGPPTARSVGRWVPQRHPVVGTAGAPS
jgi:signal peptidase I